jgi:hypothetical protein
VLHLLGDHGEAVRQNLAANVADFFYHVDMRLELPWGYLTILTYLAD